MIKTPVRGDAVLVTFELPAAVGAAAVSVCGEFNDWSPTAHPLARTEAGFRTSAELAGGRRYRFRYLLDGTRWENDWAADEYVGNEFGGSDSVVDLTDTAALRPAGGAAAGAGRSGTRTRRTAATPDASTPATRTDTGTRAATDSAATKVSAAAKAGSGTRRKPRKSAKPPGEDG